MSVCVWRCVRARCHARTRATGPNLSIVLCMARAVIGKCVCAQKRERAFIMSNASKLRTKPSSLENNLAVNVTSCDRCGKRSQSPSKTTFMVHGKQVAYETKPLETSLEPSKAYAARPTIQFSEKLWATREPSTVLVAAQKRSQCLEIMRGKQTG